MSAVCGESIAKNFEEKFHTFIVYLYSRNNTKRHLIICN